MSSENPNPNKNVKYNDKDLFVDLSVKSRTKKYFEGQVKSVTAVNDTGEFDILPMHANFITLIKNFIIMDKGLPSEKKIEFESRPSGKKYVSE